ncbi:ABC transporter permease [Leucobacter sp. CSA2]|uniref:ABC transporter permease n=1 Tax=Leucobacter edaphi TaxID=2796472 RepID=A0A934QFI6_9MICO|nr:ABC transporter permease [Leucobacter edaphi]MBK0422757.1 ABC transporter permease [Leucobacter edaphi]
MLATLPRDLRVEAIKALTLRSVQVSFLTAILAPAVLAVASGASLDPLHAEGFPAASHGFETAGFAQPLVILIAALIVGSEYSDGQLRTSLLANPRRIRFIAAKFAVIAGFAALVGAVSIGIAVLGKRAVLAERGILPFDFTAEMLSNLLGVALNFGLIALIAAALTLLARTVIVALIVLVPLVLGLSISLVPFLPALKFLPDLAGIQLLMPYPREMGLLEPGVGAVVMACWAIVLGGGSWIVFRGRDVSG